MLNVRILSRRSGPIGPQVLGSWHVERDDARKMSYIYSQLDLAKKLEPEKIWLIETQGSLGIWSEIAT